MFTFMFKLFKGSCLEQDKRVAVEAVFHKNPGCADGTIPVDAEVVVGLDLLSGKCFKAS